MEDRDLQDLLDEADRRGLRRALIVTALGLEMDAVRAHLSEPCSVQGRDGSIYECGVFSEGGQDWLVVVIETGAGTHPAQSAVQNAHFSFQNFEIQLLIGIGGSRKEDDAPLGAVVASDHVYMPYGGKETDRGRNSRPREFPADSRLVNLARKVRRDKAWPNRVRPPLDGELPTPEDYPFEMPPIGHVAPIASIESVLAGRKSQLEALLARECNDACIVEMEGYGAVYAAFSERTPSLVIRGVSDLAMEKSPLTDKRRQPVAACHAAAFGFEFLGQLGARNSAPYRTPPNSSSQQPPSPATAQPPVTGEPPLRDTSAALLGAPTGRLVILNLDLDAAEATPERIAEWQAKLRELTGSENLEIVGTEAGSVRLVVEDPTGALSDLDLDKLRADLAAEEGVALLGRVDEPEYRQLSEIEQALRAASGDLLSWPTRLPDGGWIDRPELSDLIGQIRSSKRSTTALLGLPGAGKSALLATLGTKIASDFRWPVLAIKADLLPSEIATEEQLAEHLALPDRPSVLLLRLAKLRPVVLLIDQLDAIAAYLDLKMARLNVLMNLIRRLGEVDNVHIVLSSRAFEFEHDVRLKTIQAQDVRLALPSWPTVSEILGRHGVLADGWPDDAREVMRSPQALTIYLGLDRSAGAPVFVSYQEMLERLWDERVTAGASGPAKSRLVSEVAEQMAADETLWLPKIRFEDHSAEIMALESAGVLTPLGGTGSLGFSHQTLFDHALARSFARRSGGLAAYVLNRQESLFLRPKLWATLTYLRGVDPASYNTELEAIWATPGLRRHLRYLLIDFLGQQQVPTDREAILLGTALTNAEMRPLALKAIAGSGGWFDRLADGAIADAMSSDADLARMVLISAWHHAPQKVAELLKTHWLGDPSTDSQTWMVLQSTSTWTPEALEIGTTILSRTDIVPHFVDSIVATLGVDQPDYALALVRAALDRGLANAIQVSKDRAALPKPEFKSVQKEAEWRFANDLKNPIKRLVDGGQEWDTLPALAEKAPKAFLDSVWPWFLQVLDELRKREGDRQGLIGYALAYEVDFRFDDENELGLPEPSLLAAVRSAVETLAAEDPHTFLAWAHEQSDVDALPVHRLIAHTMALQPDRWAQAAYAYLMADRRRWYLGPYNDLTATTTKLVRNVAEIWSQDEVDAFTAAVVDYSARPPLDRDSPEARQSWRRSIRRLQLALLRSLPSNKASAAVKRRVLEESRVFPDHSFGARFSGVSTVGSRMDSAGMARANDADILNAFRTLPDSTDWHHPNDWMSGGNIQLSREFATFAKAHPDRAFRLIQQLTPEIGSRGSGYALDAMAEEGDGAQIQGVILDLVKRGFDSDEFRSSAASAIERLTRRNVKIEDETVATLEQWLKVPISPVAEEQTEGEAGSDQEGDAASQANTTDKAPDEEAVTQRSMLWGYGGISILPGGDYPILSALIHARLGREDSNQLFPVFDEVLQRSSEPQLWESLIRLIGYIPPGEDDARPDLIGRIFDRFPDLATTKSGTHLLAAAHWWSHEQVRHELESPAWQATASGRQSYGELIGLLAIVRSELEWPRQMAAELIKSSNAGDVRAGIALSAANLWPDAALRRTANDLLVELIPYREAGVWASIFDLFRLVDGLSPDVETVRLLDAIAEHIETAPPSADTFVAERLQTLLPHEGDLVARIALGLVGLWRSQLGDVRTGYAMAAPELVDLAVTLHRLGPETREKGTQLFEDLIAIDAYTARDTLDQIDNRFRNSANLTRPRLPRSRARAQPRRR